MNPRLISVIVFFAAWIFLLWYSTVRGESLSTSNLVPGMADFTTSGGTSFGTGAGCDAGAFCTAGTNQQGGTYASTFDVPLTEAEIQQGFTLNSGITVSSHESNTQLETCGNVLQSGDCRDIFSLTISLFDAGATVEQFIHQEEMDFEGLQAFTFTDTVAANDYGVLTGLFELFGIDAGFPSGFYGPAFSVPTLTIDYQTVVIQQQVQAEVEATVTAQVEAEIIQVAAVETVPVVSEVPETTITTFSEPPPTETIASPVADTVAPIAATPTLPALPTFSVPPPVAASAPATADLALPPVPEIATSTADLAPPTAAAVPVIAPIAPPPTETQQAQNTQAEAQIAEVQAQPQPQPEPVAEVQPEPQAQPEPEAQAEAQPETEAQPEPEAQAEAQAEPEAQAESAPTTEPEPEPEQDTDTREAEATDAPAPAAKETPKTVAKAAPKAKAKRMTPAVAAQTVVNNIAPSQRYGDSAQVVTLVAMTLIGETAALLKQPTTLTDVTAYADTQLADGPSMIDRLTNYQMFGQANGLHADLIESQWRQ